MFSTLWLAHHHSLPHLLSTVWDAIEKDWLAKWKERLCNPDITPWQVMQANIEELDITVAHVNDAMDWRCWDDDDYNQELKYTSEWLGYCSRWCVGPSHILPSTPTTLPQSCLCTALLQGPSEVQSKMIVMGHQISSCHVLVVRSFFILWKTLLSS